MSDTDQTTVIGSRATSFFRLFCGGRFKVPWHQRRYDWTPQHVEELLQDINEAMDADRRCYFLGTVILVKSASREWHINDGQQRMVTLSLICARLRRLFTDHNDSRREHLALRVLFDIDENSTQVLENIDRLSLRVTPPRDDKIRFNAMIRGRSIGTNGKLTQVWRQIDAFVFGMGVDKSKYFFDFLVQKLEVACLDIPDSVDPNSVYETINCRGKHLDELDLIRNHLYSYFNAGYDASRRDHVHENLEGIYTQLRGNKGFTDYVRCYFQSRYGFLQKSNFYRETRRHIQSNAIHEVTPSDYVFDLVDHISQRARVELFRIIATPSGSDYFTKKFDQASGHASAARGLSVFLRELHTYKITQPLLFTLLSHYIKESDGRRRRPLARWIHVRIKHITSFVMRTAFVSPKFEPSHFESEFSNLAESIMSATNVCDVDVDGCLKDCDSTYDIIDDKKFKQKMGVLEMRDTKKIKRLLFGVNSHVQSDGDLMNESRCTVEHILPKADRHWTTWRSFQHVNPNDWVNRIGNLTLLGHRDNKPGDRDNRDFAAKKNTYSNSAVHITREVGECDDWTPGEIVKRQKLLATHAASVWSFEEDMG